MCTLWIDLVRSGEKGGGIRNASIMEPETGGCKFSPGTLCPVSVPLLGTRNGIGDM